MYFPKAIRRQALAIGHRYRRSAGLVMPIVVAALVVAFMFIAFCADIMRDCAACDRLQYAAETAAIHAYSRSSNPDGTYNELDAKQNMLEALNAVGGSQAWNTAPAGLKWNETVNFEPQDLSIMHNPLGSREVFIRVSAKRAGSDAITQLFMPFVNKYAGKVDGKTGEADNCKLALTQTAEVIGQPASRIGAGVPRSITNDYGHVAVFPLAISYSQFKSFSALPDKSAIFTLDLLGSKSPKTPSTEGHVKGCFVNVVVSKGPSNYYGSGRGQLALSQLIGSLKYFAKVDDGGSIPPGCVERGSMLSCFDTSDAVFVERTKQLLNCVKGIPAQHCYIVPVIADDPSAGKFARVVGFSHLRLLQVINEADNDFKFRFQVGPSIPLRNATFAPGFSAIPTVTGKVMTAPPSPGPFALRTYSCENDAFSPLARGVVLAPAISPRQFN
jgi:hypothetical protein